MFEDQKRGAADRGSAMVFIPGLEHGGGAERYAVSLALSLLELGYSVQLATTKCVERDWIESHFGVVMGGVELLHLPSLPPVSRRLPQAVFDALEDFIWFRKCRGEDPRLFINCLYRSEVPGAGTRNYYVCHFPQNLPTDWSPWWRRVYMNGIKALRRLILGKESFTRTYDSIWANSKFTAKHVSQRWGTPVSVLYPPCLPIPAEEHHKEKRIIAVGRFEPPAQGVPNKRFDVMLDAFAELRDLHRDGWSLDIVGAAPPRAKRYLQSLVKRSEDLPVRLHVNVDHRSLQDLYKGASLYWHAQGFGEDAEELPETQEHFGITTVEAMSAGCVPVVYGKAGPFEVASPVVGVGAWSTLDQLQTETRRLASMSGPELGSIAHACRRRALEFDLKHFQRTLAALLGNPSTQQNPKPVSGQEG